MPKTYLFFFFLIFSFGSGFGQVVPAKMKLGDMQLTIESSARKQIQQDVDRLTRSPTYFNILVDRMNLYFPIIEREHKKEKVPDEIKFLVIQESALVSDAVSIANAVGFWQFKDFTAREVGLTVDRKVDERLNIVSSSRGSGKYFNFNNQFFDNWAYAVIAYQAGAGGAQKHVDSRKYGEKRLTITTKTYWYLKKFIAHVVAFSPYLGKPHSEGIWLLEDTNAGGKTLEQLAKKHKVELEELQTYNKWLKRGPVPTDRTYTVLIPKKGQRPKTSQRENEKELAKIEKPITKTYPKQLKPGLGEEGTITVIPLNRIPAVLAKPGENLHRLSARVGLTEEKFRSFNDLKADEDLQENEFYYLKKKKNKSSISFHVLRKDESLWDVSQQYGIKLAQLKKKNRMAESEPAKPGRVLWLRKTRPQDTPIEYHKSSEVEIKAPEQKQPETAIPSSSTDETEAYQSEQTLETVTENPSKVERIKPIEVSEEDAILARRKVKIHTVAKGESLWSISRLYQVELSDLLRWNDLPDPSSIAIGQNIQVKAPIEEASKDKEIIEHTVAAGETVYAISRKYNMTVDEVMDLNKMNDFNLDVGQNLKVYKNIGE